MGKCLAYLSLFFLWGALSLPTYFSLCQADQLKLLCGSLSIVIPFLLNVKRIDKLNEQPLSNGFIQSYLELEKLKKRKARVYYSFWGLMVLIAADGWGFFLWGGEYYPLLFSHSAFLSLYFTIACFAVCLVFEKTEKINRSLANIAVKGLSVEKRMRDTNPRRFYWFVKRKQGILGLAHQVFRILPLLSLLYPLILFGLYPLILERFPTLILPSKIKIKIVPLFFGFLILIYAHLVSKYKKLV